MGTRKRGIVMRVKSSAVTKAALIGAVVSIVNSFTATALLDSFGPVVVFLLPWIIATAVGIAYTFLAGREVGYGEGVVGGAFSSTATYIVRLIANGVYRLACGAPFFAGVPAGVAFGATSIGILSSAALGAAGGAACAVVRSKSHEMEI
jgi:hypothetical protein